MSTSHANNRMQRTDRIALWAGIAFSLVFAGIIWAAGRLLEGLPHPPDTGASWYYWKLPAPDAWPRLASWGLYALHQVAIWGAIYCARRMRLRYQARLHPVNVFALAANAVFFLLHLVQTHVWYDGLAQDVSIWSSQGSVILMLVLILIMENRRRGLLWGKKAPLAQVAMDLVRRYHTMSSPGPPISRRSSVCPSWDLIRWATRMPTWRPSPLAEQSWLA